MVLPASRSNSQAAGRSHTLLIYGLIFVIGWISKAVVDELDGSLSTSAAFSTLSLATTSQESGSHSGAPLSTTGLHSDTSQETTKVGWKNLHAFVGIPRDLGKAKTPSQLSQDRVVAKLLHGKTAGYFVDLAANDAVTISNTYPLEQDYNWTGLCIEPNPEYWANLLHRKCTTVAAVVGETRMDKVQFNFHQGTTRGGGGGIVREDFDNTPSRPRTGAKPTQMYTVPLLEVLQRLQTPPMIDYLSLDVEGAEYFIMQHFPFDDYKIAVMTIERPRKELCDLLLAHGYSFLAGFNQWGDESLWVHSSVKDTMDMSALDGLCITDSPEHFWYYRNAKPGPYEGCKTSYA